MIKTSSASVGCSLKKEQTMQRSSKIPLMDTQLWGSCNHAPADSCPHRGLLRRLLFTHGSSSRVHPYPHALGFSQTSGNQSRMDYPLFWLPTHASSVHSIIAYNSREFS